MNWRQHAACRGLDPALFYPEKHITITRGARMTCTACPVQTECLETALANPDEQGVWAGTTERERRTIRANRRRAAGVTIYGPTPRQVAS